MGSLKRFEDWDLRLAAYLAERLRKPFRWGENDCATFAAQAVEAITGVNPMPFLRYKTARGAAAAVARHGGLESALDGALGTERRCGVFYARRGDVVLGDCEGRQTVMICVGRHLAGPGVDGLVTLPLRVGQQAWRV